MPEARNADSMVPARAAPRGSSMFRPSSRALSAKPSRVVFELDKMAVYYGTFRAVRDVTMRIREKEITAIIVRPAAAKPRCCAASTE